LLACGWQDIEPTLSDRTCVCRAGLVIDRDRNAAINLVQEAGRTTGSSSASHTGDRAALAGRKSLLSVQLPCLKQEPDASYASA
jgi:transposase